jgi:3-hydroxyisobutyrate dehydrogenase-like beta-hydroxyacid dehydrogenase
LTITRVAMIGLGAMGLPMARRLATTAEVELAVYDLDPARAAELPADVRRAASIAEVASGAEFVLSAVPADQDVRAVVGDLVPVARPGQTLIELSTIAPATIEEAAAFLGAVGVRTLSVGMTGGVVGADAGRLRLFVGGTELTEELRWLLSVVSEELLPVGGAGAAKALKIVNNMVIGTLDCAIAEALALAEQYGLGLAESAQALAAHGADSWTLQTLVIGRTVPDDLGPGVFSTRLMAKDMRLYSELAAALGRGSAFAGLATSFYRGASAHGFGEHFHPIVVRWLERGAAFGERPLSPLPPGADPAALARQLATGVAAVQTLVAAEAVDVLRNTGVAPDRALSLLLTGSARNDSIRRVVERADGTPPPGTLPGELADALATVIRLADAADEPATYLEAARHVALGYVERYGAESSVWLPALDPAPLIRR